MNRKDREITDKIEILRTLDRCSVMRIGMFNGDYPYITPVSFGLDFAAQPSVYFHSAKRGLKIDCIGGNRNVCVEADIFHKVEPFRHGITVRYESVIGFGTVYEVDGDEKIHGLRKILEHYGYFDYPLESCKGLPHTAVYKIVLHSLTGKRNMPSEESSQ